MKVISRLFLLLSAFISSQTFAAQKNFKCLRMDLVKFQNLLSTI